MQKPLLVIGVPHEAEYSEMVCRYLSRCIKSDQNVSLEYPGGKDELLHGGEVAGQGKFFRKGLVL